MHAYIHEHMHAHVRLLKAVFLKFSVHIDFRWAS